MREMKTVKGWIPAGFLAATLLFGSTVAHAGIIYGYTASSTTTGCTDITASNSGIIYGFTGIIYGFTGIIYGYADPSACSTGSTLNTSQDTSTLNTSQDTSRSGILVAD